MFIKLYIIELEFYVNMKYKKYHIEEIDAGKLEARKYSKYVPSEHKKNYNYYAYLNENQ